MDELIYGVWKGRAYDNRRTIDGKAPEGLPLSEFLAFNSGNPVAGFAGPQGFLMFENRVTQARQGARLRPLHAVPCGRRDDRRGA